MIRKIRKWKIFLGPFSTFSFNSMTTCDLLSSLIFWSFAFLLLTGGGGQPHHHGQAGGEGGGGQQVQSLRAEVQPPARGEDRHSEVKPQQGGSPCGHRQQGLRDSLQSLQSGEQDGQVCLALSLEILFRMFPKYSQYSHLPS